jgi:hypothetical protein
MLKLPCRIQGAEIDTEVREVLAELGNDGQ